MRCYNSHDVCVLYVKGYESLLRQVLQCGRPPGRAQAAAPLAAPRPTRRRPRTAPVATLRRRLAFRGRARQLPPPGGRSRL